MSTSKNGKKSKRVPREAYERELERLQVDLVEMQQWVIETGARIVVIFEGRDAAGKGGAIKRIVQYLNPRSARVLGYCTDEQYERFLRQVPQVERMLIEDGIILLKYWFSVSDEVQQARFQSRLDDPMRRWKLSDTDLFSITKWEDYSRAKDAMFDATDTSESPWWTIESDDKRAARLNVISHLLSRIPYEPREPEKVTIPSRPAADSSDRPPREKANYVPDHAATLTKHKKKGH